MTDMWRERTHQVGWALLPLRAFLAFVFIYGGISKIADRTFLDASSPLSMHASLVAVRDISPIGGLLGPVEAHSFAFGVLMAGAETAVGLGMLLGLFTRVAAVGGMLITLCLWLTVSWGARPWYTSADLVYVFAFAALLIAGAGGVLSADAWLAHQRAVRPGVSEDRTRRAVLAAAVAVGRRHPAERLGPFSAQRGQGLRRWWSPTTDRGRKHARQGQLTHRFVRRPRREWSGMASADEVPVGGAHKVTSSSVADTVWVMQLQSGQFTALDATCPHQGCPVSFISAQAGFVCPCHQSSFDASGKVLSGPASSDLKPIPVTVVGKDIRSS